MSRHFRVVFKGLAGSLVVASFVLSGCKGEDRPNVDVIGGNGSASVSVSASGIGPSEPSTQSSGGGTSYQTATNVDIYFQMGPDLRDITTALSSTPPNWDQAKAVYEQGKNQIQATGAARPLASQLNDAVYAVFPNGPATYGRPGFVDALIKDGLAGTGRANGLSDASRKEIVEKGVMMLFYGKALQEFTASKTRLETGAANAPGPVDETFAIVAGAVDGNTRPFSLLAVARSREADFKLEGKLAAPLETSLVEALAAAQANDKTAFNTAYDKGKGFINSIFYLSVLRYAKVLEGDTTAAAREVHLAEGWAFWQSIRAAAASGSTKASQDIETAFTKNASATWTKDDTTKVYAALNDSAVLQALGIPTALQVKTPPAQ